VRAAAPQAVTAYNKWLAGLRGTRWPSDVQPLVDRYLKLSPVGLKTLQRLQRVTTVDELMTPGDPAGLKSLSRAEAALRDKVL
jgi:hypothetical protein